MICIQPIPMRSFGTCSIAKCFRIRDQEPCYDLLVKSQCVATPLWVPPFFIPCERPLPRCLRTVRNPAEPIRWNAAGCRSLRLIDIPAWPLKVCVPPPENLIEAHAFKKVESHSRHRTNHLVVIFLSFAGGPTLCNRDTICDANVLWQFINTISDAPILTIPITGQKTEAKLL